MSIEFLLLQDTSASEHEERIETLRNQGFERVFSKVTDTDTILFIAYMERETAPKLNGMHTASVVEALEKRVERLNALLDDIEKNVADIGERLDQVEAGLEVIDATLDTDDNDAPASIPVFNPFGTLIDWIGEPKSAYEEVINEALTEDEAQNLANLFAAVDMAIEDGKYPLEDES